VVDQTYRLVDEETGEEILVNSWREMILCLSKIKAGQIGGPPAEKWAAKNLVPVENLIRLARETESRNVSAL
jgi:hypothetical protein